MRTSIVAGLFLLLAGCGPNLARLRAQLHDPDPEKRIAAIEALVLEQDTASVPLIVELLKDSVTEVRRTAARGLGPIGDLRAVEPLAEFYGVEEDATAAGAAQKSLVNLGAASVDPLVRLLRSIRPDVRSGAAYALGRIGSANAVDPLIRLLGDREVKVRRGAVFALRQIGDSRGLEAVARLVDTEQDISEEAAEALSGQGYQEQLNRAKRIIRKVR
jgi:HEAT repeat protein